MEEQPPENKKRPHPLEAQHHSPQQQPQTPQGPRVQLLLPGSAKPQATYILLGINLVIFAAGFLISGMQNQILQFGALSSLHVVELGEYYRLFTAMFIHGDLAHIFFNSYVLYILGIELERLFGYRRFLIIYILGGLGGSMLSVIANQLTPGFSYSVGASGAIFAIWGAYGIFLFRHKDIFGQGVRRRLQSLVGWAVFNLFLGFIAPEIDNWGHIGGLVGGIILAWFIAPRFIPERLKTADLAMVINLKDTNPLQPQYWIVGSYFAGLLLLLLFSVNVLA